MKQVLEISNLEGILNNLDKNSNFFNPSDSFPGWHAYLSPEIVGWTKKFAIPTTSETLGDKPFYILEHYRVGDTTFVRVKIGDGPAFTQTFNVRSLEYLGINAMWNNNLKKLLQITNSISSTKNEENMGILDKYDKFFILVHPFYLTFFSSAFSITSERLSEYHHTLQRLFSEREDYGIIVYENPISYLAFSEKLHCKGIDLVYLTGKYQANANSISDVVSFVDDGTPLTNNRQVGYKDKKLIFGGSIAEFCLKENISWHRGINITIAPQLIITKDFENIRDHYDALRRSTEYEFYSGFQRFEVVGR